MNLRSWVRVAVLAAVVSLGAGFVAAAPLTGAKPASPQPAADKLTPGLAVNYNYAMFHYVNEVAKAGKGKPGKPLANLDHKTDNGNVLTADASMGVGALITGFIKLDKPGTYVFKVLSNDGVKLTIGGVLIHEDPGVHSDTMSPPIELAVTEPGWFPLAIDYFQRKGTSALKLYWTPPGGSEAIVPPDAFAHIKS
ncbi:MAG: PA14 domain-containing protein [Alphaproteobacteria bacterium]